MTTCSQISLSLQLKRGGCNICGRTSHVRTRNCFRKLFARSHRITKIQISHVKISGFYLSSRRSCLRRSKHTLIKRLPFLPISIRKFQGSHLIIILRRFQMWLPLRQKVIYNGNRLLNTIQIIICNYLISVHLRLKQTLCLSELWLILVVWLEGRVNGIRHLQLFDAFGQLLAFVVGLG